MQSTKSGLPMVFVSFLIVMIIYSIALGLGSLLTRESNNDLFFGVMGLAQFFFLLAPTIYFAKKLDYPLAETFRLKMPQDKTVFLWAFVGLIGLQFFTSGVIPLQISLLPESISSSLREMYSNYLSQFSTYLGNPSIYNISYALMAIAVSPGICEELLFRGFLQKSLERETSFSIALAVSSLIFAIIHFSPETFIPLLAAGFLLGYFAYISKSIFPSMMIHILLNGSSIISFYFNPQTASEIDSASNYSLETILMYFTFAIVGLILMLYSAMKAKRADNAE